MNVFFDNCTPPVLAATINGFLSVSGGAAFHIRDVPGLPRGRHSSDIEWIQFLQKDPAPWIFITGDRRVLKNRGEREALRSAGLHGFILAPGFQTLPANQMAALVLWKWPLIEGAVASLDPPSMHEIPVRKASKLGQIPF